MKTAYDMGIYNGIFVTFNRLRTMSFRLRVLLLVGALAIAGILTDVAFATIRVIDHQSYVLAPVIALAVVLPLGIFLKRRRASMAMARNGAASDALKLSARLQAMTRRHMCIQEMERRRLARELHDRVSSSLMAIGLNLDLVKRQLASEAAAGVAERLSATSDLLRQTMLSAREISADLHPASLDYDGIAAALEDYGKEFSGRTGVAVEVICNHWDLRFPPDKESALFRIAQEALLNCAKHAAARNVTLALNCTADHVVLSIADDGTGFDLNAQGDPLGCSGLGLFSMKERAEAFAGTFRIESSPETGTAITVEI